MSDPDDRGGMFDDRGQPAITTQSGSGPFAPTTWALGGAPQKGVDIPITVVFMVLFMLSAAWHMAIFQSNKKRGHKFLFSAALFGFSMSRIVTCVLRIASVSTPTDVRLGIAAAIFVAVGVLIVFVINLIWAQRILRAYHPKVGWHRGCKIAYNTLYALVALTLLTVIVAVVQTFYTLSIRTRHIDRALQLYGQTFLAVVSSMPLVVILIAHSLPRRNRLEKFGAGKMSMKVGVLVAGTSLIALGAWYRCGTTFKTPVPHSQPLPLYLSKGCFYMFNFGVDILTLYLYGLMRVDLRFHIPDGAHGPGSYMTNKNDQEEVAAMDLQALTPVGTQEMGTVTVPQQNSTLELRLVATATTNLSNPSRSEVLMI
ncbi:hypothetical protein BDU57DRAFT_529087 [Ampelomyces quisqualis]|uniref:Uncharacterized protein n=1 Tax=Ampelomyces quisqualis TaxID=50730 RepID=A0A6A5QKC4_AMPQU|nr:hypothetical protein BDU57DRAFT_529087 [Ampelomyces quisqualis]